MLCQSTYWVARWIKLKMKYLLDKWGFSIFFYFHHPGYSVAAHSQVRNLKYIKILIWKKLTLPLPSSRSSSEVVVLLLRISLSPIVHLNFGAGRAPVATQLMLEAFFCSSKLILIGPVINVSPIFIETSTGGMATMSWIFPTTISYSPLASYFTVFQNQ